MASLDVKWIHGLPNCENNVDPPMQVHRFDENTFIIRQNKCVDSEGPFMYLLFGDDRVMLLDSGATRSPQLFPIAETVRGIIQDRLEERSRHSMPILICHSHSHGDHAAGDSQFANQEDLTVVQPNLMAVKQFFGFSDWPEQPTTLQLGNRTLDVFPIPGHEESHIALYDRVTKILLSGDSIYPGLLVVRDWNAYRESIARLKTFADDHEISFILGGHIEMKSSPGKWFGYPQSFQPEEHALQLEKRHLVELNNALSSLSSPQVDRHNDFIVQPVELPFPPPD
jgi:hydroxyacylglutathione hydrolase